MSINTGNSYQLGQWAESLALDYLQGKGLRILEKNYHTPAGEIDLIIQDGDILGFIEVRYRANSHYLSALESIDSKKCIRIINASQIYIQGSKKAKKMACRFDVITVTGSVDNPEIGWIKNAFQA